MIRTVGIVGGTFDPIHYGHLRMGAEVMAAFGLSEVRMIPAGIPPHRSLPFASGADRLAMATLGCGEFKGLVADSREIDRPGPSYTVTTLQALHSEDVTRPLALIIGSDAFAGLTGWHRWEQLFTLAHLIVIDRPGAPALPDAAPAPLQEQWNRRLTTDPARLFRQLSGAIIRQRVTPQAISSTAIRAALARGRSGADEVRGLLPAAVLAYIDRNQLYRPFPDAP